MPGEKPKFFVSYARKDQQFVLTLARDLLAAGANLWVDQFDIRGGDEWDRAVENAIQTSEGMLVVLSPDATASDNVRNEFSYALDTKKRVIPVVCRKCSIPLRLSSLHHIDFTVIDKDAGLTQVLASLEGELSEIPL